MRSSVDEKMRNDYIENYTRRFGEFKKLKKSEKKNAKGKLKPLMKTGMLSEKVFLLKTLLFQLILLKMKKLKNILSVKKLNDTIDFDLRKAFPNDNEIAGYLKEKKDEVEIKGNFRFTINEINRFEPAEIGTGAV